MERAAMDKRINRKTIGKTIKWVGRILLNYLKLLLIPFVFLFMLLALLIKGIKILMSKDV